MNFFSPILQLISNNIFNNNTQKDYLVSFSGGQDSIFVFFLLLHLQKQQNCVQQLAYKNHNFQPNNFYFEFHVLKLSFLFGIKILISTYLFSKNSELEFKFYRYDLLFRQSLYYQTKLRDTEILISHSQTDLIESKFVEFFQKNIFSFFIDKNKYLTINILLEEWPIGQKRKNTNWNVDEKAKLIFLKKINRKFFQKKRLIEKKKFVRIERPIWLIPRMIILEFIQNHQLPVQNDETNFLNIYLHNKCRHQIIPLFRFVFGKDFDQKIYQTLVFEKQIFCKNEMLNKFNRQEKNIIKIKYFYNFRCLIFNLYTIQYECNKEIIKLFFFINFLVKMPFSIKEFFFIINNKEKDTIYLLKVTFPQVLLVNNFMIIRF